MQLGQTVGAALKWMMAARFAGQLITWVVTILVIRILTPDDYGLMALAMAMIGFLSLFEEIGLGSAIVQREHLEQRLLGQIFGLLIMLDLMLYGLIWVGAPFAASFFAVPELTDIMRAVGFVLIINAFGTLPDAMLSRRMEFRGKSVALFTAMVSGSLLTLWLALHGHGVWSLVIGNLFMAAVRVVVLQWFARVWYRPSFALSGVGSAARFGGFITIDRLLWYVYSQSDALIIGKLLGKEILGFYSVGMHLASLPMQKIAGMLNEIGFSAFSRLQGDPEGLRQHFIKAVRVLSLLAFPVFLGISSVAPEIVGIFLGDKWASAVFPIQVLSLVVPLRLLNTVLPSSLYGIGRAQVSVSNNVIACLLMPVSFAIGAHWGLTGVCLAWVLAYPVLYWVSLARSLPVIGVRMADYIRAMRGPALSALVMYAAVFGLRGLLEGFELAPSWSLVLLVLLGVSLYTALALSTQLEACVDLVTLIGSEEAGARLAAVDTLAPLKALLPRPVKEKLKARRRAWHLKRALRTLKALPPGAPVEPRVLQDLHYGWGNSGWAADVDFLKTLCELVRTVPGPVLECGSGLTTLLMGALGHSRGLRVWALENDAVWCARVQAVAARHALGNVSVCHAPLREFDGFTWYDVSALELPRGFGLVVCDGPPDATPGGRYGLLPVMREGLASGCVILLDDIQREHERAMLGRWQRESTLRVDTRSSTFAVCRFA